MGFRVSVLGAHELELAANPLPAERYEVYAQLYWSSPAEFTSFY